MQQHDEVVHEVSPKNSLFAPVNPVFLKTHPQLNLVKAKIMMLISIAFRFTYPNRFTNVTLEKQSQAPQYSIYNYNDSITTNHH